MIDIIFCRIKNIVVKDIKAANTKTYVVDLWHEKDR
jgi:hypothetical protein